ncbi:DUF262 domain-containing protein [Arthrobacter sp. HLT1-21]
MSSVFSEAGLERPSWGRAALEIQPEKENLDRTFSQTVFNIDFYQRSYKWGSEPVRRLLDDVFFQFDEAWSKNSSLEPTVENVMDKYPWYYLNTYVTNRVDGRVYVVDGQQRLTTLTLVLIKLFHLSRRFESSHQHWIESKIVGHSGSGRKFWMNHAGHLPVLHALYEGTDPLLIDTASGVTSENMVANYRIISDQLDGSFAEVTRFNTFVIFFLQRLVLVNLDVDSTQVPMVFEVINDRGVKLKPHEILKGKLLGQIEKNELSRMGLNELWDSRVEALSAYGEDTVDDFFRAWLKGRYSDTRSAGRRFDGDYHREMFKQDLNKILNLEHSPSDVKKFLTEDFDYYTNLYLRVQGYARIPTAGFDATYFNGSAINKIDSQSSLILAACSVQDPEEDEKIAAVTEAIDRMSTLLRLQGAYSSNEFLDRMFLVAAELRNRTADEIPKVFEIHLAAEIALRRGIADPGAFNRQLFNTMTVDRLGSRFTRYFFARIERFIAEGMQKEMKHSIEDLVTKTGPKNGFHIEHILSYNAENRALFDGDDERFESERARLGGILLLRGRDNISSNNEPYAQKLRSYSNSLYWNETLREDTYKAKKDFTDFIAGTGLKLRAIPEFGPAALHERHSVLGDIVELLWPVQSRTDTGAIPLRSPE